MISIIKKILSLFGIGIYRLSVQKRNKEEWIREKNFGTVIDVGANVGQFAKEMRWILPSAKIISFEPVPECFEILKKQSDSDENWMCINYAIGANNETLKMNVNKSTATSSILKSSAYLKKNYPVSETEKVVDVVVKRLDGLEMGFKYPILLKIDVQGYEMSVLEGAVGLLPIIDTVLVEVSFVELYENQPLFNEVYSFLTQNGFLYVGNYDQINSPINGVVLQSDCIFFRKN